MIAPDTGATFRSKTTAGKTKLHEEVMALPRQAPHDLLYLDRLAVIGYQLEATLARASGDTERARGNDEAADYAMVLYQQVRATADGMTAR